MRKVKQIAALAIALVMLMCMSVTAFSAEETGDKPTRTIEVSFKQDGHTYTAYRVFSGDVTEGDSKTITNIQWGDGVNGDALLEALKNDTTVIKDGETLGSKFADAVSAADVANAINKLSDDSAAIDAISALINENLATAAGASTSETSPYTIEVEGDGYYFVKDTGTAPDAPHDAVTKFILRTAGETKVEVNAKTDFPDVDKKIIEGEDRVTVNNVSIGDTVNYEVTSAVPDMTYYKTYFFQIQDTLDKGLTLKDDSFKVTIGGEEITDFAYDDQGDGKFNLTLNNFISYKDKTGEPIVITYDAVLNENALIGDESNDNTVKLVYSNDPNQSEGGVPGSTTPDENNPKGETPDKTVHTYVSAIKVLKLDGATNKPLKGVEFTLTGEGVNIVLVQKEVFTEDPEGTYWALKDGTYTTDDPNAEGMNQELYVDTTTKYKKTMELMSEQTAQDSAVSAFVDEETGVVQFTGLGAGVYTLHEETAPDGYKKIQDVTVTINFNNGKDVDGSRWSYSAEYTEGEVLSDKMVDGVVEFTIENNVSVELPETGGMGTTVFYIVGGVMLAGAALALIVLKKRSSDK